MPHTPRARHVAPSQATWLAKLPARMTGSGVPMRLLRATGFLLGAFGVGALVAFFAALLRPRNEPAYAPSYVAPSVSSDQEITEDLGSPAAPRAASDLIDLRDATEPVA
jgi:hypothetical protein